VEPLPIPGVANRINKDVLIHLLSSQKKNHGQCGRKDLSVRHLIAKFGEECPAVYGLGTIPFEDASAIICDMRDHVATVVSRLLGIGIMINNRVLCT